MMDRFSICKVLAKRNEIDPFLKRMVIGDQKRVTYDNIVQKLSWSKRGEAAQTLAKIELKCGPSDYLLFLTLQNFLSGKKLGSREDCENRLLEVFANKYQDFF
ncbi:histone-lysine N-methyltransferase SETMAR-like [Trichonephila clavipes]|nr:histone-lysine N-methyltransferase SETMAR-like [Trichonephila clavipes]